ncbi:hypothetical protein LXA47_30415 [Massilia sp. P8910]|uniref:hypothetical protein n=1 Tax=Massilia antarctica TaxID=2765360 RepID=UPI001E2D204E|nr:hypothetical protein [Massilia antarctica]MCE3607884.1 hypothetical protein [Massilia antarctica]
MERYDRHFVSQRIGRAVGAVEFDGTGAGVVIITATGSPARLGFSFTLAGGPEGNEATPALAELLLRTAISQVHKEIAKPTLRMGPDECRSLSSACAPWIGDLEGEPYGMARPGYALQGTRENE